VFSLRTLLIVIAVSAVGIVGLTTRNAWWASVMSTLTWALVAATIVAAIVCRGRTRLFAAGFAVAAGLYLAMIFVTLFEPFSGTLVSSRVVSFGWKALDVPRPQGIGSYITLIEDMESRAIPVPLGAGNDEQRAYQIELRSFFIVGHCLWALFFGCLGALFASYAGRERSMDERIAGSPPA